MDHCEIPPTRTESIEDLGQGAFGRVRKAILKDGLGYFDLAQTARGHKIVAIKELYGEGEIFELHLYLAWYISRENSAQSIL